MRISQQIWPRPVALVCVGSKPNVMTASFITPISFSPKILGISISPERYTFELLEEYKKFSICMCDRSMLKEAVFCGNVSGREVDKIKETGMSVKFFEGVPYVEKSPSVLFCELLDTREYGDHYFFVGKVFHEIYKPYTPLLHGSGSSFYYPVRI